MRRSSLTAASRPLATGRNPPTGKKAAKKTPAKKAVGRNPPTGKPKN